MPPKPTPGNALEFRRTGLIRVDQPGNSGETCLVFSCRKGILMSPPPNKYQLLCSLSFLRNFLSGARDPQVRAETYPVNRYEGVFQHTLL